MNNLFKATIYRQTMFAEFEKDMHEKREKGEILTSSFLSDNYYECQRKYRQNEFVSSDAL